MRITHLTLAVLLLLVPLLVGVFWGGVLGLLTGSLLGMLLVTPVGLHYRATQRKLRTARREDRFRRDVFQTLGASAGPGRPHPRAPWLRVVPDAISVTLADTVERLKDARGEALPGALDEARSLAEAHPTSPAVHALLSRLLLQVDDREGALAMAAKAIRLAMHHGDLPDAVDAYRACVDERDRLDVDPVSLRTLGRVLARQGDGEGARWAAATAARRQREHLEV